MSKNRSPTVYLFVNKDSASASLSRSHGKDASAILSHVQSCRNQKNKQLHMFRVDQSTPESAPNHSGPPTPQVSPRTSISHRRSSLPRSPPRLWTENSSSSSSSATSTSLSPVSSNTSASSRPHSGEKPEVDELVDFFDALCLTSHDRIGTQPPSQDLYRQLVSCEEFRNFSWQAARGIHGSAMLACTAARMARDMPTRREEFHIKATKYMQPSLQHLREQLSSPQARTLTDRQILREMLLHCVTNWYLCDWTAAHTHLTAMNCFTGCLDVSASSDRKLMDIINRCGLFVTSAQKTTDQSSRRNSTTSPPRSPNRGLPRVS